MSDSDGAAEGASATYVVFGPGHEEPRTGHGTGILDRIAQLPEDTTVWLHLREPSDATMADIATALKLPRSVVQDPERAARRLKLADYHRAAFLTFKALRYTASEDRITDDDLVLLVGPNWLVTVTHGVDDEIADAARTRLLRERELRRAGVGAVIYAVTDEVIDAYNQVLAEVQRDLTTVERAVFGPDRTDDSQGIYSLKRVTLEFLGAVVPLVPAAQQLAREHEDHRRLAHALSDVADHMERVVSSIRSLDELVNSVVDANASRLSIRQNEDMRRISAWAAIIGVPTLVAGVYGMNFDDMPELHWTFGYPLAVGLMAVAALVLYLVFRKVGWL
ncbi:MAG: magnesium and cobalt transport protein CorA [Actinocatenispora sp.]